MINNCLEQEIVVTAVAMAIMISNGTRFKNEFFMDLDSFI